MPAGVIGPDLFTERAGGENFSEVQWLRGRLTETREALGLEEKQR